jgi:pSer/pThr/pTyr-binding forkhead associated (FHA) protein
LVDSCVAAQPPRAHRAKLWGVAAFGPIASPAHMLKLTLSFKGRPLRVHPIAGPRLVVGRDPGCDLVIDSLAVAPRHLALQMVEGRVVLAALTATHPVLRNGVRVAHALLEDGDRVLVGKHTLSLSAVVESPAQQPRATLERPRTAPEPSTSGAGAGVEAYLQVQSGRRIGEILTLIRVVTRLRRIGGTEVIVRRRDWGYALSRLGEANRVTVGREPVLGGQEVPLTHGVAIEIDGVRCQFFQALATSAA